jgi:hypothetical protein
VSAVTNLGLEVIVKIRIFLVLRLAFWLITGLAVSTYPLVGATYFVGSCHVNSFSTINGAIQSPTVVAGDTIKICPGDYPEQVIVSKPLNLQGVVRNNSDQVRIYVDGLGLQEPTSVVFGGPVEPAVWVTTGPVNIQDVQVWNDASDYFCAQAAFFFQAGSSGTLNHVVAGYGTCGPAIWAEATQSATGSLTIANSIVYGIQAGSQQPPNTTPSLTLTIAQNEIFSVSYAECYFDCGPSNLYPGIYLYMAGGTVSHNTITGWDNFVAQSVGIFDGAPGVTLTNNTFLNLDTGISLNVDGAIVKSNTLFLQNVNPFVSLSPTTPVGIEFNCHVGTVSSNILNGSSGIALDLVPNGFTGPNIISNVSQWMRGCP